MRDPARGGLDPAIVSYYEAWAEETRHLQGVFRLEHARTREILTRLLPGPPATVVDVGGAAGVHALWLAARGYEVHLLDPVERLVVVARREAERTSSRLATAEVGDARDLPFDDASTDCVLLLGPLYHLVEKVDRLRAISEATRILRPGGLLFAACITRWASLLDGLAHDYLGDPRFAAIVDEDLRSGRHRNPTERPEYFTTAYFHTPGGFESELAAGGLATVGLFGLEGPAGLLSDFADRWADARKRADLMRVARAMESEPSLLGISPHLLGVARKE